MPFKSKAQQRFMFATMPETAHEWAHETKNIKKLPEKVKRAFKEVDNLKGGKADRSPLSAFKKKDLKEGAKEEKSEHTSSQEVAEEIASDHLVEDPKYYQKLKKMEKRSTVSKLLLGASKGKWALGPNHLTGGLSLGELSKRHWNRSIDNTVRREDAAFEPLGLHRGKGKHAMNPISLRAFHDELAGIDKVADMLSRRRMASSRGQAQGKLNAPAPVQHGFDFGNTQSVKPQQSVHPPLVQQQRVNQGIAKEQFHERARRGAMAALHQPEQMEMKLQTKKERISAKKQKVQKPAPSKIQRVAAGAGGVGKKMLGAGVGLAGAGILGAGLVGRELLKKPEEQQPQQQY